MEIIFVLPVIAMVLLAWLSGYFYGERKGLRWQIHELDKVQKDLDHLWCESQELYGTDVPTRVQERMARLDRYGR